MANEIRRNLGWRPASEDEDEKLERPILWDVYLEEEKIASEFVVGKGKERAEGSGIWTSMQVSACNGIGNREQLSIISCCSHSQVLAFEK